MPYRVTKYHGVEWELLTEANWITWEVYDDGLCMMKYDWSRTPKHAY